MKVEEARQKIKELENYIKQIESYEAKTFEQTAIKLYVLLENVREVAAELNSQGFRVGKRKVEGKDVSDIIRSKSQDDLHSMAQKMFKRNKKRASSFL